MRIVCATALKKKSECFKETVTIKKISKEKSVLISPGRDLSRGQWQVGSLTGAVHLSNGNAGVLRRAQGGQKPPAEQKGKSSLDLDFQYEYGP